MHTHLSCSHLRAIRYFALVIQTCLLLWLVSFSVQAVGPSCTACGFEDAATCCRLRACTMLERVWESAVVCERVPLGSVSWSQLSSESVYHFGACLRVSMCVGWLQGQTRERPLAHPISQNQQIRNLNIVCDISRFLKCC